MGRAWRKPSHSKGNGQPFWICCSDGECQVLPLIDGVRSVEAAEDWGCVDINDSDGDNLRC